MLQYFTAGESHGKGQTVIIMGMPAGLPLSAADIQRELARRHTDYGRGGRAKIESDAIEIQSGVRWGKTLGSPITLWAENKDWANWTPIMGVEAAPPQSADLIKTAPRPGHADFAGAIKYNHADIRNVLERASARETLGRVAAGAVAKRLLAEFAIEVWGCTVAVGDVEIDTRGLTAAEFRAANDDPLTRCPDAAAAERMKRAIDAAKAAGDTLGGIFEVRVFGAPVGLGSYVHWEDKLSARLAGALMSIQSVKGVEIGLGFAAARLRGSAVHDELFYAEQRGYYRETNNAGGIEGGMSNGEQIVLRAALKPIATLLRPLRTVDLATHEPTTALVERSDVCVVPRASVVGEAVVAFEMARALREKYGGDSLAEMQRNYGRSEA